jgi:hypothetical protein
VRDPLSQQLRNRLKSVVVFTVVLGQLLWFGCPLVPSGVLSHPIKSNASTSSAQGRPLAVSI